MPILNNNRSNRAKKWRPRRPKGSGRNNPRRNVSNLDSLIPTTSTRLSIKPSSLFANFHQRLTLPYRETISFGGLATPQMYIFRGNGPYDPNQTGTGQQPVGWDNYLVFYDTSYAVGSQIRITFFNTGSTVPVQIAITPTAQNNTLSTYDAARMMPHTRHTVCDGSTKGGRSYQTLTHSMSVLGFFGGNFDRDYLAIGQSVPGKQFYWSISLQSADQVTTLTGILQIDIYYDIIFQDRKSVPFS